MPTLTLVLHRQDSATTDNSTDHGEDAYGDDHDDDAHGGGDDHGAHAHAYIALLVPSLLIAVGVLFRSLTDRIPIPYTALMLLLGFSVGMLLRQGSWAAEEELTLAPALWESATYLSGFDAHLLLFVFLPPLLFESAASMEWHLCQKAQSYILLLAGPGVIIGTFFSGALINQITLISPSGDCWEPVNGYLLGVILSATDPVAVVALLKDLGAKKSLATAIEGESLLNDGSAYVIFLILFKIVEGDSSDTLGDYLWTLLRMSMGGVIFGTVCGALMKHWLKKLVNDSVAEISVTFCVAYLTFFIAEHYLKVSGVISVVFLGLHFSHSGKSAISASVHHVMHEFWEMMGFFGNTLIFSITGLIIGHKSMVPDAVQFLHLFLIYIAATMVRTIVVFGTYFFLRLLGNEDLQWRDQIVGIWGGLRGAVGLALAVLVHGSTNTHCEMVREGVLFHTAGIVMITVCFNATTLPAVMRKLGMDKIPESEQRVHENTAKWFKEKAKAHTAVYKTDPVYSLADWQRVGEICSIRECNHAAAPLVSNKTRTSPDKVQRSSSLRQRSHSVSKEDKEHELRTRVLMCCKEFYVDSNHTGQLPFTAFTELHEMTNTMLDNNSSPLDEWKLIEVKISDRSPKSGTRRKVRGERGYYKQTVVDVLEHPCLLGIVLSLLVVASVCSFLIPETRELDYVFTAFFVVEMSTRFACGDPGTWIQDPRLVVDIIATIIDTTFLIISESETEDTGAAYPGGWAQAFRILRLLRLMRFARIAELNPKNWKRRERKKVRTNSTRRASRFGVLDRVEESTNGILCQVNRAIHQVEESWKNRQLALEVENTFQIMLSFMLARKAALHEIESTLLTIVNIPSIDECQTAQAIKQDIMVCGEALSRYQALYCETTMKVITTMAAHKLIGYQEDLIEEVAHHGILEGVEMAEMTRSISASIRKLHHTPLKNPKPTVEQIRDQTNLMRSLPKTFRKDMREMMEALELDADRTLEAQGAPLRDQLVIIGRGFVNFSLSEKGTEKPVVEFGSMDTVPSMKMSGLEISEFTAATSTVSLVFVVDSNKLEALMLRKPGMVKHIRFFQCRSVLRLVVGHELYKGTQGINEDITAWKGYLMKNQTTRDVEFADLSIPSLVFVGGGAFTILKTGERRSNTGLVLLKEAGPVTLRFDEGTYFMCTSGTMKTTLAQLTPPLSRGTTKTTAFTGCAGIGAGRVSMTKVSSHDFVAGLDSAHRNASHADLSSVDNSGRRIDRRSHSTRSLPPAMTAHTMATFRKGSNEESGTRHTERTMSPHPSTIPPTSLPISCAAVSPAIELTQTTVADEDIDDDFVMLDMYNEEAPPAPGKQLSGKKEGGANGENDKAEGPKARGHV